MSVVLIVERPVLCHHGSGLPIYAYRPEMRILGFVVPKGLSSDFRPHLFRSGHLGKAEQVGASISMDLSSTTMNRISLQS